MPGGRADTAIRKEDVAQAAHRPPMAAHPICRQSPKVGAVCVSAHVRICAGGAGQPASLPQKHAARPAIPAGAATTPARAVRPTPTSAPPPSTQEKTARRAATGAKPTSAATPASKSCASGRAISAAVRRHVWQRDGGRLQLRRSTDRAPLQLNASDRDRPHRPACAGRRRRSREPQTSVWRAHHRHRHAQGRSSREPAP